MPERGMKRPTIVGWYNVRKGAKKKKGEKKIRESTARKEKRCTT